MAEVVSAGKKGSKRAHKIPRIDLTPMVDLGFLLITFFMYTTALAKPKVMQLNNPLDVPPAEHVSDISAITVIPVAGHKMIVYSGMSYLPQSLATCGFEGLGSLRARIILKKSDLRKMVDAGLITPHQLYVIIKPDASCSYGDVICVLDEMTINDVRQYAIVREDEGDKKLVADYGK